MVRFRVHGLTVVLRTAPVPNPPPGTDWSYTVPGQFLENVTGVTAQLDTGVGGDPVWVDSSGHGHNGIWLFSAPTGQALAMRQPGLVTGGFSVRISGGPMGATQSNPQQVADIAVSLHDSFTLEFLVKCDPGAGQFESPVLFSGGPPVGQLVFNPGTNVEGAFPSAVPWVYAPAPIFDGAIHHIAFSRVFGVSQELYVDGVALAHAVISTFDHGPVTTSIRTNGAAPVLKGFMDEVAVYESGLSAGQVATHYAASLAGQAAYSAAVLADAPAEYFHFDDLPTGTGTGRQVTLFATDGNNEVAQIPSGFAEAATPGPYMYSWQTGLNSSTQTPNGETTTVAIPKLVLPAGYTIGTQTLDLSSLDQWSNIVVWWDDNIMNALNPISPYVYPPGELLVPRFLRSGP